MDLWRPQSGQNLLPDKSKMEDGTQVGNSSIAMTRQWVSNFAEFWYLVYCGSPEAIKLLKST